MHSPGTEASPRPHHLADETVALVRRWLAESAGVKADPSAARLAGVLKDPDGLDFTLGFVDRVVRPEDLRVAGRNFERLSHRIPRFLPWYLRSAIVVGGGFAAILPWPIVPIARRVLRGMVGHLVIDANPRALGKSLSRLRADGLRLNVNLLGEAVLGDAEADRRLAGTRELLARDDVDYVSIKVSSVVSQVSLWAFEEMVERIVERITPLYELAAASETPKFVNLDMEEFRDLDLTLAVFRAVLDKPELRGLEAGIVLQAYLPDALQRLQELTAWSTERRAAGGAGIKVRLVKGANLAMEHVDAALHGWPLATYASKVETDTNYKRILRWAFTQEHTDAVRIGVAGHNLFDLAYAWLLAQERGVERRVEFEMLLGMASGQAEAVKREVGGLLLYTPVVHPREFDSAINYLVRRLEENASPENFMSGLFDLAHDDAIFVREKDRFLEALAALDEEDGQTDVADTSPPASHRVQNRAHPTVQPLSLEGFRNEQDTDPAIAVNRDWGRRVLERSADSTLGAETIAAAHVPSEDALSHVIAEAAAAVPEWGELAAEQRAQVLHDAGDVLAAFRGRLIEVMASETGKTIAEGDVEVSEAVDFAHYYAGRAIELERVDDVTFTPDRLTVVAPPWNFPLAIPAGSVLAALAVGSAVILKPAPQSRRTAAVLAEALWEAGVPETVLRLVDIEEGELGRALVSDPAIDRVILTGSWETAALFRSWRDDLPLLAETSGKNAIVVTPSADLDLAVADIVKSAFGHAGQKCSAASLVIVVGSVARSERFERQLVDAVKTLRVGYPQEATTQMGPLIEPAAGKLLGALSELAEGESWLVEPKRLDDTGRLWSPGVRTGVAAGSEFHLTEYFGPVLGIMRARTLEEAIQLQNEVPYGLTAGIHSLDTDEVSLWLDTAQAGNLYVNRGITGAIVRRQPFGGWKRSTVGTGFKAGGPNYLLALGGWQPIEVAPRANLTLDGVSREVARVIKRAQAGLDFPGFDRLRRAARSDERAWSSEFGVSRDVSALGLERNVFRYRPVPVTLRLAEDGELGDLLRLVVAAARTRSPLSISSAVPLPTPLVELFTEPGTAILADVVVESDERWISRAKAGEIGAGRLRLVGGDPLLLAEVLGGSPDVAIHSGPVTTSGRVELLTFLREQSVSITAHRFGNPDRGMGSLPV